MNFTLYFFLPDLKPILYARAMCGSPVVEPYPAHSPEMTNIAYTGDAGARGIYRAGHPSAAGPLVLIVEDHEDTRFLLRRLLEMRGYRVAEAADGEDAVQQATALAPDLIVMDGSLPRMDGCGATRRIRERDELQVVPVVFLSGHAHPADREAAFAAGCCDYLVKPLDTKQLDRILEKRLKPHEVPALIAVNTHSRREHSS